MGISSANVSCPERTAMDKVETCNFEGSRNINNSGLMDFSLKTLQPREYFPGFSGKMIHGEQMSLAFWEVEEGAAVPEHQHPHEQIMKVLEGRFAFTLGGKTREYLPGDIVLIPSGVTHSGRALTPCRLMDIFSPVREDYK